jgi:nicotinamide mononucleotide adenylyltransferase
MLFAALKDMPSERYQVCKLADIGDDARWVSYLQAKVPVFDVLWSGNPHVIGLFENAQVPVHKITLIPGISGKYIRKLMASGDGWRKLVPQRVVKILEREDAEEKLRKINEEFLAG